MPKHYTKSLVYILIVFLGSISLLEILAHSQLVKQNLLVPSVTGSTTTIDIQLNLLDVMYTNYDTIDCIIVGSSVGANDINPIYLSQGYGAQTKETFICLNFSSAGLRADSVGVLSTYLVKKYRPSYLIYAISPIAFSPYCNQLLGFNIFNTRIILKDG